jgi:hypothetical protein
MASMSATDGHAPGRIVESGSRARSRPPIQLDRHTNGQPAVAPEVEVLVVAEVRGLQVQRRAREQGLEGDPGLQAPELRADAVVVTVAECEVVDRRPRHVEAIGLGEVTRVTVGRGTTSSPRRTSWPAQVTSSAATRPTNWTGLS